MQEIIRGDLLMVVDADYHERLFKQLCFKSPNIKQETSERKGQPFNMYWELFTWAAILGFNNNYSSPISGKKERPFRWQQIPPKPHQEMLIVLAVSTVKKLEILQDAEEVKRIIEEHANGGLEMIDKERKRDSLAYFNLESLVYNIARRGDFLFSRF